MDGKDWSPRGKARKPRQVRKEATVADLLGRRGSGWSEPSTHNKKPRCGVLASGFFIVTTGLSAVD